MPIWNLLKPRKAWWMWYNASPKASSCQTISISEIENLHQTSPSQQFKQKKLVIYVRFGRFAEATVVTSYFLHFILWNNLCSKSSPCRNSSKVKGGSVMPCVKALKIKTHVQRKRLFGTITSWLYNIYIYINIFVLNHLKPVVPPSPSKRPKSLI